MNARSTLGLIASGAVLLITGFLSGQPPMVDPAPVDKDAARFITCDITLDSGATPLAAWQIDLRAAINNGHIELVGVEGSPSSGGVQPVNAGANKKPFEDPPFYDPEALTHDHIILAAFSTAPAASLPTGPIRIARLHMRITGAAAEAHAAPEFTTKLVTAADPAGTKITPTVRASLGDTP